MKITRRSQKGGSGTIWWGEATDEPAHADARPTENANCTTTKKDGIFESSVAVWFCWVRWMNG